MSHMHADGTHIMANAVAISHQKHSQAAAISLPSTSSNPTPRSEEGPDGADSMPKQEASGPRMCPNPELSAGDATAGISRDQNFDAFLSARKETPGSIISIEAFVGHSCKVPDFKDALAEVDGLKSDIAGMEAVLTAVKGATILPQCMFCSENGSFRLQIGHTE
jgi:hypothetical protein